MENNRPTAAQLREFMTWAGLKTRTQLAKLTMSGDSVVDAWLLPPSSKNYSQMPAAKWELAKELTNHPERMSAKKQLDLIKITCATQ